MLFYPLYCHIINLTSLKIVQALHLLLGFAENQGVFWDFKIQNSIRITKGSDNAVSENRGSTVHVLYIYICDVCVQQVKMCYVTGPERTGVTTHNVPVHTAVTILYSV